MSWNMYIYKTYIYIYAITDYLDRTIARVNTENDVYLSKNLSSIN